MKNHDRQPDKTFWHDGLFWLVLSLGPLCWLGMYLMGLPLRGGPAPWTSMLWIGLIYPLLEECVFRGGIQPALAKRAGLSASAVGISLANIVTSSLFAAMHLINQPPLWAALVFVPSLLFGWARDRYGNIHACIILHITYNAGFVWFFSG